MLKSTDKPPIHQLASAPRTAARALSQPSAAADDDNARCQAASLRQLLLKKRQASASRSAARLRRGAENSIVHVDLLNQSASQLQYDGRYRNLTDKVTLDAYPAVSVNSTTVLHSV